MPSLTGTAANETASGSALTTPSFASDGGDLLVVAVDTYATGGPPAVTVTDSAGNAYTLRTSHTSSGAPDLNIFVFTAVAKNTQAALTVTVNVSATVEIDVIAASYSGLGSNVTFGSWVDGIGTVGPITATVNGSAGDSLIVIPGFIRPTGAVTYPVAYTALPVSGAPTSYVGQAYDFGGAVAGSNSCSVSLGTASTWAMVLMDAPPPPPVVVSLVFEQVTPPPGSGRLIFGGGGDPSPPVGKVYSVDGPTATGPVALNHAYDPGTDTRVAKTDDTTARSGVAVGVFRGRR